MKTFLLVVAVIYSIGLLCHFMFSLLDRDSEDLKGVYVFDLVLFPSYIFLRVTKPALMKLYGFLTKKVC